MSALEVTRMEGLATVQDAGRPGHMHAGVPHGGALVPELLACANTAAGNPPGAAALEVFGRITVRAADGDLTLATEDGAVRALARDAELDVPPSAVFRVRYLAIRGGVDVPLALGGRGTLLVARLGGHEGRALRRGDRLAVGGVVESGQKASVLDASWLHAPVRVVLGPDQGRFEAAAVDALLSGTFAVLPSSDRVGTRLDGPRLARPDGTSAASPRRGQRLDDDGVSAPMAPGAIEVPASGPPIVLGPDHPTTGGYPVLAVVARADLGRFAARRVGERVRFVAVSVEESRARGGR